MSKGVYLVLNSVSLLLFYVILGTDIEQFIHIVNSNNNAQFFKLIFFTLLISPNITKNPINVTPCFYW